jgi:hypothetical protein
MAALCPRLVDSDTVNDHLNHNDRPAGDSGDGGSPKDDVSPQLYFRPPMVVIAGLA